jgi:hypothetical protein
MKKVAHRIVKKLGYDGRQGYSKKKAQWSTMTAKRMVPRPRKGSESKMSKDGFGTKQGIGGLTFYHYANSVYETLFSPS